MTGRRYERKLVKLFEENGWGTLPSGSSGSGTDFDRPDVVVGDASVVGLPTMGIEAKSTRKNAYTIDRSKADQLIRWCTNFGAMPVIAVYWKGPPGGNVSYGGWYFRRVSEVRRSPAENDEGTYHLRPRREDRHDWAQMDDLNAGRLTAGRGD